MKNEHVIWGYGKDRDGRQVVMFGITDIGLEYLTSEPGMTLTAEPPSGMKFADVSHVVVFWAPSKADIKRLFELAGMVTMEAN